MNKTILGVIAAVIVIAAVGYFALMRKPQEDNGTKPEAQSQEQANQSTGQNANEQQQNVSSQQNVSLRELAAQGSRKCTFSDGQGQGTVYANTGKMRVDVNTTVNGASVSSHGIMDGTTYYGWVDGQPSGFKMSLEGMNSTPNSSRQTVDFDKELNYDCSDWSVDASVFTLPAKIQFTDFSSFSGMPGM
jgi:hypothetical protein